MRFAVANLGPINHAEIEMGNLTVVCGKNNNGKTYLTYTLGTFLTTIKTNLEVPVSDGVVAELLNSGEIHLNLREYVGAFLEALNDVIPRFTGSLSRFLAMHPNRFAHTNISLELSAEELLRSVEASRTANFSSSIKVTDTVSLTFERGDNAFDIRVVLVSKSNTMPSRLAVKNAMSFMVARVFDDLPIPSVFPETFVITCERTGSMLYRQELLKNRRKDRFDYTGGSGRGNSDADVLYQRPIERELDFVFNLGALQKSRGQLSERHPEILQMLSRISGGVYRFDSEKNQVQFLPQAEESTTLALPESSSTVRSLAELYFYLAHKAAPGQLLMFDEPELNLHPSNQRKLARLIVSLVNAGLKVFVTTHSDYIVREFNALIRVGRIRDGHIRQNLMNDFDITAGNLLCADCVKVYMLDAGIVEELEFDTDTRAFGVPSFDDTIESFNRLYSRIKMYDREGAGHGAMR